MGLSIEDTIKWANSMVQQTQAVNKQIRAQKQATDRRLQLKDESPLERSADSSSRFLHSRFSPEKSASPTHEEFSSFSDPEPLVSSPRVCDHGLIRELQQKVSRLESHLVEKSREVDSLRSEVKHSKRERRQLAKANARLQTELSVLAQNHTVEIARLYQTLHEFTHKQPPRQRLDRSVRIENLEQKLNATRHKFQELFAKLPPPTAPRRRLAF